MVSVSPTGLNPAVYADFDAALALAAKYDLAYDFVLFNSPSKLPQGWINDPENGQGNLKSVVYIAILKSFKEHGIRIPYPQREVRMRAGPERASDRASVGQVFPS